MRNYLNQLSKLLAAVAVSALVGCGGVEGDEADAESALTNPRFYTVEATQGSGAYCLGDEDCPRGGGETGGIFVCGATPDADGYTTCTTATSGPEVGTCTVVTQQCYHNNGTQTCHTTPPQTVYATNCNDLNR